MLFSPTSRVSGASRAVCSSRKQRKFFSRSSSMASPRVDASFANAGRSGAWRQAGAFPRWRVGCSSERVFDRRRKSGPRSLSPVRRVGGAAHMTYETGRRRPRVLELGARECSSADVVARPDANVSVLNAMGRDDGGVAGTMADRPSLPELRSAKRLTAPGRPHRLWEIASSPGEAGRVGAARAGRPVRVRSGQPSALAARGGTPRGAETAGPVAGRHSAPGRFSADCGDPARPRDPAGEDHPCPSVTPCYRPGEAAGDS